MLLQDKVAVVTGAGRGIGREIVRHFLEEGAAVVAFDVRADLLDRLNEEFAATGRVRVFSGNVTDKEDLQALKAFTLNEFHRVDILVNNAGIARYEPFLESTDDNWRSTFAVNVEGTYQCSRLFAEVMKAQQAGVILNMSSVNGMLGEAGMSHYNASKAAILLLSRTMANELAMYGIRCNSICPGYILTELSVEAGVGEKFIEEYVRKIPVGRLGNPRDVAYAAAFLASDRASFITGTELVVDGGQIGLM